MFFFCLCFYSSALQITLNRWIETTFKPLANDFTLYSVVYQSLNKVCANFSILTHCVLFFHQTTKIDF